MTVASYATIAMQRCMYKLVMAISIKAAAVLLLFSENLHSKHENGSVGEVDDLDFH